MVASPPEVGEKQHVQVGVVSADEHGNGDNAHKFGFVSKTQTFATVAAKRTQPLFPPIDLPNRQYGVKDGKPSINFTATEMQAGIRRLEFALVAKFSAERPSVTRIREFFAKTWDLKGKATIGNWLDGRHVLIILQSEVDVTRVLSSPCRRIDQSLFRLFRWTSDFSSKKESTKVTAWIRLPGLPTELFDSGFIKQIVSGFARFLDTDEPTKLYTAPSMARVCVEVDVTKPIPDEVWIQMTERRGVWQPVITESRLAFCSRCKLHGHEFANCRKRKDFHAKDSTQPSDSRPEYKTNVVATTYKTANQGMTKFNCRKEAAEKVESKEGQKGIDNSNLQESKKAASETEQVSKKGSDVHSPTENEGWVLVSRRKAARLVDSSSAQRSSRERYHVPGTVSSTNERRCPSHAGQVVSPVHKDEVVAIAPVSAMTLNGSDVHKTNPRIGEENQEHEDVRRIEGKKSKVGKESKHKRRNKKNRLESLKRSCIEAPDETEVASPLPIPVKVDPKPDEVALNTSQRKEVEAILKFARLVGVKTRVSGEEAIQILLSNFREKLGNGEGGRKGDYNHWRSTNIFLKRGERGEP